MIKLPKNLPRPYSKEYHNLVNAIVVMAEKVFPMSFYGYSGYNLAYYWTTNTTNEIQHIHIETLVKLLNTTAMYQDWEMLPFV